MTQVWRMSFVQKLKNQTCTEIIKNSSNVKEEQNETSDFDFNFENQIYENNCNDLMPNLNDGTPILQGLQFQSVPIGRPRKQTNKETNHNEIKEEFDNPNKNDTYDQDLHCPLEQGRYNNNRYVI